MQTIISLSFAALIALAVTTIGSTYLASPERMVASFGLKPPAPDANTRAWLRLKGIRDVGCGLAVLTLMLVADHRSLGFALLALAIIPFGDMAIVLGSQGSKTKALSIHGLTCVVMLLSGLRLIHAF